MKFLPALFIAAIHLALPVALSADDKPARTLRVLQLNVWQEGTSVPAGVEKIAEAIVQSRADVVAFSEVRNYRGEDWHGKILADFGLDELVPFLQQQNVKLEDS